MRSMLRDYEKVRKHQEALEGSRMAIERAATRAKGTGFLATFWRGWQEAAKPTYHLYKEMVEAFATGDQSFGDWRTAKEKWIARAKELKVDDPVDTTIEMLSTFFE